jgi:hypothetical protein
MGRRRMCRHDIEEILIDDGYDRLTVTGGETKPLSECPIDQLIAVFMKNNEGKPIVLENDEFYEPGEIRIKKGTMTFNRILHAFQEESNNHESHGYGFPAGTIWNTKEYRFTCEEKKMSGEYAGGYYETWKIYDKINSNTYKLNFDYHDADWIEIVRVFLIDKNLSRGEIKSDDKE